MKKNLLRKLLALILVLSLIVPNAGMIAFGEGEDSVELITEGIEELEGSPNSSGEQGDRTEADGPSEEGDPAEEGDPNEEGELAEEGEPAEEDDPAEEGEPTEEGEPAEEDDPAEEGEPTEEGEPDEEGEPTEEGDPAEEGEPDEEDDPSEKGEPTEEEDPSGEDETTEPEEVVVDEEAVPTAALPDMRAKQTVVAFLYTDDTCSEEAADGTVITVTGEVPEGAYIRAYPVEVALALGEDAVIIMAYDITIFYADGTVFQPETPVNVNFAASILEAYENISIYHMADLESEPELVVEEAEPIAGPAGVSVDFQAHSFSIYIVTSEAATTGYNMEDTENAGIKIHVGDSLHLYSNISGATNHSWAVAPAGLATLSNVGSSDSRRRINAIAPGEVTVTHTYRLSNQNRSESMTVTILPLVSFQGVDSTSMGVKMWMTDFSYPGGQSGTNGTNADSAIPGSSYGNGSTKLNLLTRTTVDGEFPDVKGETGSNKSLSRWFGANPAFGANSSTNHIEANYLFQQDADGYLYFDSAQNFAQFSSSNKAFTLYNALGTPSDAVLSGGNTTYFYMRGNFMPYNTLNVQRAGIANYIRNLNKYDYLGQALPTNDPRYNEALYGFQEGNNFHFGMYLDANFYQPKGGKVPNTEDDMIFDFTGDDDMWVYIDGVLVLDLGGIHDAQSGWINFATGEVQYTVTTTANYLTPDWRKTSIRAQFDAAKVENPGFQIGSMSIGDYIEANFIGNTFKSFTGHRIQVFYMERGAGASNLRIRFNVPTLPDGDIAITKQVENGDLGIFGDREFDMRLMVKKEGASGFTPMIGEYKIGNGTGETDAEGWFPLKHGQTAVFSGMSNGDTYYVEERGLNPLVDQVRFEIVDGDDVTLGKPNDQGIARSDDYIYLLNDAQSISVIVNNRIVDEDACEITITKYFHYEGEADARLTAPDGFENTLFWLVRTKDGKGIPLDPEGISDKIPYSAFTNGSYTFKGLPPGTYEVREELLSGAVYQYNSITVTPGGPPVVVPGGGKSHDATSVTVRNNLTDGTSEADRKATFDITNPFDYAAKMTIVKVDQEGRPLNGAEFTLYKWDETAQDWAEFGVYVPVLDGSGKYTVTVTGLGAGFYRLEETEVPDGYAKHADIYFTVEAGIITITDSEGEGTLYGEFDGINNILRVTNDQYSYVLPEAGGIGTPVFIIAGILIVGAAVIFMVFYLKRGAKKRSSKRRKKPIKPTAATGEVRRE